MIILASDKNYLHKLRVDITEYLKVNLGLEVKSNYQVFPVAARGIDFVGYVFKHTHIKLRKRIKQRMARVIARNKPQATIAAYTGWAKHCNSVNLLRKLC